MKQDRSFAILIFIVVLGFGAAVLTSLWIGIATIVAFVVSSAIQADLLDKPTVLRLDHFHAFKGNK